MPRLFMRDIYSNWDRTGRQTVEQRAAEQVAHILGSHQPLPLPEDAQKEIDAIYQAAQKGATIK